MKDDGGKVREERHLIVEFWSIFLNRIKCSHTKNKLVFVLPFREAKNRKCKERENIH